MEKTADIDTLREALEARLAELDGLLSETALALRDGLARERRRVGAALDRIRNRRYGLCCACEAKMTPQELTADPAAPFCAPCEAEIRQSKGAR